MEEREGRLERLSIAVRTRTLAFVLSAALAASCSTGDGQGRSQPSTALQDGESVTFSAGEVEPLVTRIRCRPKASAARPVTAFVPLQAEGAFVIADGEAGYAVSLAVTTHRDGSVRAVCRSGAS